MRNDTLPAKLCLGALAGLAGSIFIKGGMAAAQKWMPQTLPPLKADPGEYMVEKVEKVLPESAREKIPDKVETAAAQVFALGYGITFASIYSLLPRSRRKVALDGTLLGVVTWAAGYLGWLPATGLMPPVWKQKPRQIFPNIISHAVFGIVAAAVLNNLEKRA